MSWRRACIERRRFPCRRFATHSFAPGFEMTQWRHLFCVSDKVWKNALNAHGTVEAIPVSCTVLNNVLAGGRQGGG